MTDKTDKLLLSEALVLILFGILLPTWDVGTDILLSQRLLIPKTTDSHPLYGLATLCPVVISTAFTLFHWYEIECKKSAEAQWIHRLMTFLPVICQCWTQYKVVKILFLGLWKKDSEWKTNREVYQKKLSCIGKVKRPAALTAAAAS